jgi:hypothetical protein
LIDAASARMMTHQGSTSRPDLATEVPGWRRFVPTERRLTGDTGGESGSASTQSTPRPALQIKRHKEEAALRFPQSRQQHFFAEPRESGGKRLNRQAGIENSSGDSTDLSNRAAKHREAVLHEFLRWREQLLLSHKKPPQGTE